MSTQHITQLPDIVQGGADVAPGDNRRLSVSSTSSAAVGVMLHAHIGGIHLAMSERNWQILFASLKELEVEAPPTRTFRIVFDDEQGEARIVGTDTAKANA